MIEQNGYTLNKVNITASRFIIKTRRLTKTSIRDVQISQMAMVWVIMFNSTFNNT